MCDVDVYVASVEKGPMETRHGALGAVARSHHDGPKSSGTTRTILLHATLDDRSETREYIGQMAARRVVSIEVLDVNEGLRRTRTRRQDT